MPRKTYKQLAEDAREYYRLCTEAVKAGIPTSLDDPRSPKTVAELREAIQGESC